MAASLVTMFSPKDLFLTFWKEWLLFDQENDQAGQHDGNEPVDWDGERVNVVGHHDKGIAAAEEQGTDQGQEDPQQGLDQGVTQ